MESISFPAHYQQLMPYLIVPGAADFSRFMQQVFGAEETMRHMRDEHIIQHAELKIGDSVVMFADATGDYSARTGGFFVYVPDADAAHARAIAAGATQISPVTDQPYGRSGGVLDPFGNTWWITTHTEG